jgi:hypothetical protein
MGCSPDRGWLLAKEAAITWRLSECWVDVDASWVLVLRARLALHQCLSIVVVISAWAADAYLLLLLLLLLLLRRSLLLLRSLETLLWCLRLRHRVHSPVNILAVRGAL